MNIKSDKKSNNTIDRYRVIFVALICILLTYLIVSEVALPSEEDEVFLKNYSVSQRYEDLIFNEDVYWVHNDGTREKIVVPGEYETPRDESMILEAVLPEKIDFSDLEIRSSQQIVKIYINDELRVDYDTENTRPFGEMIASRYVFCPVSESDAGKTLKIELVSHVELYSGMVNEIYACDKYEFWSMIADDYVTRPLFGAVLIIIGVFTFIISICVRVAFKNRNSLEYLGCCVAFAGTWLLCESKFRQLIGSNGSAINNICYIVIMLAPIAIALYINDVQGGKYQKWFLILVKLAIANVVISNVLQITKVFDYIDLLPISHVIVVVAIALSVLTFILDGIDGSLKKYFQICMGLGIVFVSVLIESALAYVVSSFSGLFLMIGGIVFVLSGIFMTITDIREIEVRRQVDRINEQKKQTETMLMQLIRTLPSTIEAKDEYLRGHSTRVAEYTVAIAREMGMEEEEISKLWYAATLHDLGKIGVPDTILNKPFKLSDSEFDVIKTHTTLGAGILSNVEMVSYTSDIAMHHHERYDGRGYPDGLGGEEISLGARIVAVADAYDAMNSNRIYRRALPREVIWKDINRNKGIQFDPDVATVFLKLLDSGEIERIEKEADSQISLNRMSSNVSYSENEVEKVLSMVSETMMSGKSDEGVDMLTGLATRRRGEERIARLMSEKKGALIFCDMDNLKTINDRYGHKSGDKALKILGDILGKYGKNGQACRIGGDEFLLFLCDADEAETIRIIEQIIEEFSAQIRNDAATSIATLSAGICLTNRTEVYSDIFNKTDKALYYIKQRGKDNYYIYNEEKVMELEQSSVDIDQLKKAIMAAGQYSGALEMEYREFTKFYEYISKMCKRYNHSCDIVLVTLEAKPEVRVYLDDIEQAMNCMEKAINSTIRNVDVCTRYTSVQFLIILFEAGNSNLETIMTRIFSNFNKMYNNYRFEINYEVSSISDEEVTN